MRKSVIFYRPFMLIIFLEMLLVLIVGSSSIFLNSQVYAQDNRVQLDCFDVAVLLRALDFAVPQFEDDLSGTLDEVAEFGADFQSIRHNIQNILEDFEAQCDNMDSIFEGGEVR
jgi:hypothetical protein